MKLDKVIHSKKMERLDLQLSSLQATYDEVKAAYFERVENLDTKFTSITTEVD